MKIPVLPALSSSLAFTLIAWGHSAVESSPRPESGWQDRHKLLNQRAAEAGEKARILFIGDSITQGWEGAGKEVWERYYAPRNAVNLGIGGDRTQHVLWRLENGNLAGLKPKAAVVMIGTNNSNGEDNSPDQIVEGVTAIVRKLRETLPDTTVLLLAIFPRGENYNAQRGKILQINQVLQRVADGDRVRWIDFGSRFVDDDGLIPRSLMPDFLHLSPEGYALWAETLEPEVARILGETPIASASPGAADLSGEWIWTIRGPDGNPIEAPLILTQQGDGIRGRFARGADRWLEIENGKWSDGAFSWTVKRDRESGGTMTYRMTGKLEDGKIVGKTTTEVDGAEVTADWGARRK